MSIKTKNKNKAIFWHIRKYIWLYIYIYINIYIYIPYTYYIRMSMTYVYMCLPERVLFWKNIFGGFLEYGYSQSSSISIGLSIVNHPAIGVPPFQETPIWDHFWGGIPNFRLRQVDLSPGATVIWVTSGSKGSKGSWAGRHQTPNIWIYQSFWGVSD